MASDPAYELAHDVERFEDLDNHHHDLVLRSPQPFSFLFGEQPLSLDEPIVYQGYPPNFEHSEFPVTKPNWLVMSKRMLAALDAVAPFQRKVFRVEITDYPRQLQKWVDAVGKKRADAVLRGFCAVQVLEHLDVFDFERSRYTRDEHDPSWVRDADEIVLRVPEAGLPPLFHVKGLSLTVFISSAARQALKAAQVTGVLYYPLGGSRHARGVVDVPTPAFTDYD